MVVMSFQVKQDYGHIDVNSNICTLMCRRSSMQRRALIPNLIIPSTPENCAEQEKNQINNITHNSHKEPKLRLSLTVENKTASLA